MEIMMRGKDVFSSSGKTRAKVEKEFLEEMDRLRQKVSKYRDRDYRDALLQRIDRDIESFGKVSFVNVTEMAEHATATIRFVSSWVSYLHPKSIRKQQMS
jgi:hypothetical protein